MCRILNVLVLCVMATRVLGLPTEMSPPPVVEQRSSDNEINPVSEPEPSAIVTAETQETNEQLQPNNDDVPNSEPTNSKDFANDHSLFGPEEEFDATFGEEIIPVEYQEIMVPEEQLLSSPDAHTGEEMRSAMQNEDTSDFLPELSANEETEETFEDLYPVDNSEAGLELLESPVLPYTDEFADKSSSTINEPSDLYSEISSLEAIYPNAEETIDEQPSYEFQNEVNPDTQSQNDPFNSFQKDQVNEFEIPSERLGRYAPNYDGYEQSRSNKNQQELDDTMEDGSLMYETDIDYPMDLPDENEYDFLNSYDDTSSPFYSMDYTPNNHSPMFEDTSSMHVAHSLNSVAPRRMQSPPLHHAFDLERQQPEEYFHRSYYFDAPPHVQQRQEPFMFMDGLPSAPVGSAYDADNSNTMNTFYPVKMFHGPMFRDIPYLGRHQAIDYEFSRNPHTNLVANEFPIRLPSIIIEKLNATPVPKPSKSSKDKLQLVKPDGSPKKAKTQKRKADSSVAPKTIKRNSAANHVGPDLRNQFMFPNSPFNAGGGRPFFDSRYPGFDDSYNKNRYPSFDVSPRGYGGSEPYGINYNDQVYLYNSLNRDNRLRHLLNRVFGI